MIWLTWRQHRRQALFTLIGLAALAALVAPTGVQMHRAFVHSGLADCLSNLGHAPLIPMSQADACQALTDQFSHRYSAWSTVGVLFVFLPLLVGMFWGAPLVARETEQGTHRLVWTQGVSRRHWALVKFGLVGAATLAAAVAYGLGMSWWLAPLSRANSGRFGPLWFDTQGLVPVGYTLFAVALGVFAGTVWHKVLPAMAVSLVSFVGVRIAVGVLARPHYLSALTRTSPLRSDQTLVPNPMLDDWFLSRDVRDASGKVVYSDSQIWCGNPPPGTTATLPHTTGPCGPASIGEYNWQVYQPAGRFWLFQGIETGIFVALAALLLYLAVRRVRRIA